MSSSKPAFEVIDRRGQRTEEPVEVEQGETLRGEVTMTGIGYMLILIPTPQGIIPAIRAAGTRSTDKQTFVVEYLLPAVLPNNQDFFAEANKRLDTFRHCGCTAKGHCGVHQIYLKQWVEADYQRLTLMNAKPVSDALEVVIRREQEAQSRIIVPGRS